MTKYRASRLAQGDPFCTHKALERMLELSIVIDIHC